MYSSLSCCCRRIIVNGGVSWCVVGHCVACGLYGGVLWSIVVYRVVLWCRDMCVVVRCCLLFCMSVYLGVIWCISVICGRL